MEDKSKLVSVFFGSMVDATCIETLLEENDIESTILNNHQDALNAGWATATKDVELIIKESDLDKAKTLIEEYLKKY